MYFTGFSKLCLLLHLNTNETILTYFSSVVFNVENDHPLYIAVRWIPGALESDLAGVPLYFDLRGLPVLPLSQYYFSMIKNYILQFMGRTQ